ncbi:MAG: glycosyltransferase [Patescibacteria group bacterium]|jgi:UDP-N-acetylglucosamine--N-acetylmuramyl-(pentapeptide) pyrophosphoryl-undecaprenol N-acetylglucosamine transferase
MRIILCGGGTLGSVTPLLAVWDVLKRQVPGVEGIFIGTRGGIESQAVIPASLAYRQIFSGKWRRYLSIRNIFAPFEVMIGFVQAFIFFLSYRPQVILAAGGFVGVPCIWAGWLIGAKIIIHQPDFRPGLSLAFTHAFAHSVTVGFKETAKRIPNGKAKYVGNPVRIISHAPAASPVSVFPDRPDRPYVVVVGGGTGSAYLNTLVTSPSFSMHDANVVHVTGKGKEGNHSPYPGYKQVAFLEPSAMLSLIEHAAVVISRAGASALAEYAIFGKPTVLIPLPASPQVDNAEFFSSRRAAICIQQDHVTAEGLRTLIENLLHNTQQREQLSANIRLLAEPESAQRIASIVISILHS